MSLISVRFKYYDEHNDQYVFTLVDSELGEFTIELPFGEGEEAAIVKFYSERNFSVGKNIALFTILESKRLKESIEFIKGWQDEHIREHVDNWNDYIKERDEWLEKMLPLL